MENRKIVLPENVKKIIETLQTHGYKVYAVGGCVRDSVFKLLKIGILQLLRNPSGNKNIV